MANFKYQARSEAKWSKRASGSLWEGFALDEFPMYKLKEDNAVRILPPTWADPSHYGWDIWVHYNVGPNRATILCLSRMKNELCPVCEAWSAAEAEGREDAAKLKPMRRVLVWIIDRKEVPEKGPYLWAMPWTADRSIASLCRDRQSGELYQIDHPDLGYDVYFQMAKKGDFQEYVGWQLAKRPSAVDESYLNYIVQHPVNTTLQWRSYAEVLSLFVGHSEEGEDVQTSAETPVTTATPTTQVVTPPPPTTSASPTPPKPFVPEWLESHCSVCGEQQYTTPTGHTCSNSHENAPAKVKANGHAEPAPPPPAPPKSPSSRGQLLRERFSTGSGGK